MSFYDSFGHFLLQMILNIFHKQHVSPHNTNFGDILGYHLLKFTFSIKKYIYEQFQICSLEIILKFKTWRKITIVFKILKNILKWISSWITLHEKWKKSLLSQGNGFSLVGVLLWFYKLPASEKDLVHWSQGNDFSLSAVWVLLWFFKWWAIESILGHW